MNKEVLDTSLKNIGEVFPDVEGICREGFFKIATDKTDATSQIYKCIDIYCLFRGKSKMQKRRREVLYYYLKFGYSKKTKKFIQKDTGMNDTNLNNVNNALRNEEFIRQHGHNRGNNVVNEELLALKEYLVDGKGSYIVINFD